MDWKMSDISDFLESGGTKWISANSSPHIALQIRHEILAYSRYDLKHTKN